MSLPYEKAWKLESKQLENLQVFPVEGFLLMLYKEQTDYCSQMFFSFINGNKAFGEEKKEKKRERIFGVWTP